MKVGIVCGVAPSAVKKAKIFYETIVKVGHEAVIFTKSDATVFHGYSVVSKQDLYEIYDAALKSNADFYITCNDSLANAVSALNEAVGWPFITKSSQHKDRLHLLSPHITSPKSYAWHELGIVPDDVPLFIKPISGSGTAAHHSWAYKKFNNKAEFTKYLSDNMLQYHWEASNRSPGVLGEYIIQEYFESDRYSYIQCLNDGQAKTWFGAIAIPDKKNFWASVTLEENIDSFGLDANVPPGHFAGFQYFNTGDKPMVFDFNTRYGSHWTYMYDTVFPSFFDTFFDNLLNKRQEKYIPKFNKFQVLINNTGIKSNPKSIFVEAEDFPFGGMKTVTEIIPE